MKKFVDYQRSLDRLAWAQTSVDSWQKAVDNPGYSDHDKPLDWPRDKATGRAMPTGDHNRHLDDILGVGHSILAEARERFDADPEIAAARSRYDQRKAAQLESAILQQMMASARPHGGKQHDNITLDPGNGTTMSQGARPDAPARIRAVEGYYPDDWVALSSRERLNLTSTDRAYYSDGTYTLAMDQPSSDATYYSGAFRDYTDEVNAHELGHRMEHMVPGLTALEFAFVRRRSTRSDGSLESAYKMSKITGSAAYSDHEVAFQDQWAHAYAGKTYEAHYRDRPDQAPWEVFQVGMQDTYGRSTTVYDRKDDLQAFTLGVLATLATA
jgi:hypothetical protein